MSGASGIRMASGKGDSQFGSQLLDPSTNVRHRPERRQYTHETLLKLSKYQHIVGPAAGLRLQHSFISFIPHEKM
jgi:hypothetical protein